MLLQSDGTAMSCDFSQTAILQGQIPTARKEKLNWKPAGPIGTLSAGIFQLWQPTLVLREKMGRNPQAAIQSITWRRT
ncbi:hypothetical protein XELAEV_18032721mg [Xenopus laevis]|uniref:Uncharacterized protein n=1 Tax=Xenopus laevis TaxID=8355 RepID=A0A974HDB9_XENLA|nr:hypothetical protein XELAEV_18032721mg [Xenopus laevis]